MQIGRPFTFSNFLLAIALVAVVAGAWRLTQVAAIHFSLWTSAVAAAMIVTALLLGCLFVRFKAKGKVALLAVALAATALVGNYVMAATGHDVRPAAAPSHAGVTQLAAATPTPTLPALSNAQSSNAQSSNAQSSNAGSSNARPPVEIVYKSIGTVAAIMPARNPQPNQGAAFLGVAVAPLHVPATLHVRLTANAYAAQANEVVLAIFRSGQAPALKVETKPVAADGRV
ncbi:MAG TPA: hypothetical protein VMF53_11750, partial [Alphaproteobacteria bacterium]|nr:hypothetical protein [Alphaproteobacteria bacterium]